MPRENRKEVIIQEALKLFSEKGFAAVSMRDLAESAGISVSTIYHYFENKQELVKEMITRANELTEKARNSFFRILSETEKVECEPFVRAGIAYVTAYLRHESIDPLLRMLESERFHEPAAEEAWQKMMFSDPITHEAKVFEMLAARGEIRGKDAHCLAGEYHGIIMLGYFSGDTDMMARNLTAFYDRVFMGKGEGRK